MRKILFLATLAAAGLCGSLASAGPRQPICHCTDVCGGYCVPLN